MNNAAYDFETLVNRTGQNASKWDNMRRANPQVEENIPPFSVADLDIKTAPEIVQALKDHLDRAVLGYDSPGEDYWQALSSWMERRHNWTVQRDWLVCTPGVVTALYAAVNAFTQPGDGVLLFTPVYSPFYGAAQQNGREIVPCPLQYHEEGYTIDFADFEAKAKNPRNKLLLLCNPHNPVGRVWSREELWEIARICLQNDVRIASDEIHFDLILPGHTHTVLANLGPEIAQNSIVCTAPSKSFNIAGLHCSNIFIPNGEMRDQFRRQLGTLAMGELNGLAYVACEAAYRRAGGWLDGLIALIARNHDLLRRYIAENIPQIKALPLEGTYLQWLDCRGLGLDGKALMDLMQQKALFFVSGGRAFAQECEGFVRVNIASPTHALIDALERLVQSVKALPASPALPV